MRIARKQDEAGDTPWRPAKKLQRHEAAQRESDRNECLRQGAEDCLGGLLDPRLIGEPHVSRRLVEAAGKIPEHALVAEGSGQPDEFHFRCVRFWRA